MKDDKPVKPSEKKPQDQDALETIIRLLTPFSAEAQARILKSVAIFLGVEE